MKKDKIYNIAFTFLIIFVSAMYVILMINNNVWYDEAYTLAMIKHSFGEIARITAADVHPPLYYFGLKIFCAIFGQGLLVTKIFSAIPILLTMILGYCQLTKLFNKKTGFAFAMLVALMPLYQGFAVEIRMYTWASFTVFGAGIYAFKCIAEQKKTNWVIYALFFIASAYIHYFAFVSVLVIHLFLFLASLYTGKFSYWLISTLGAVIAYIPWLSQFIAQLAEKVENEYWISPITSETIKDYFNVWFQCGNYTFIYKWIFAAVYIVCFVKILYDRDLKKIALSALGSLVFIFTCVLGIGISLLIRPVFIERYAIPAIPLVFVLIAIGIASVKSKLIITALTVTGIASFAVSYPVTYVSEYESGETYIEEYLKSTEYDSLVCFVDSHLYGVLSYYEPTKPIYRPKTSPGSPFDNILPLSEKDLSADSSFLVFMPNGEDFPVWLADGYNYEYSCDVVTYGIVSNVYKCTKTDF